MGGNMGFTVKRQRPTPLMTAVQNQDVAAVKERIQAGDDIDERDVFEQTALHWAAKYESLEIVQLLLDAGAKPNARDEDGEIPLDNAKRSNNTAVIEALTNARKRRFGRKR